MADEHPRHELSQDADAFARVAIIADYFEGLALEDGDLERAEEIEIDGECIRRWEGLLRDARSEVHTRQMKDGS